jgi:hypothetical protein
MRLAVNFTGRGFASQLKRTLSGTDGVGNLNARGFKLLSASPVAMPPRRKAKAPSVSPKKLTQTTLPNLFSSLPTKSTGGPKSPSKSTSTKARRVPLSTERDRNNEDDSGSDVGAIQFEEKTRDTTDDEQPHLSPQAEDSGRFRWRRGDEQTEACQGCKASIPRRG